MDLSLYKDLNGFTARHDWLYQPLHSFAVDGQILVTVILSLLFLAAGKYRSLRARRPVISAAFSATHGIANQ